MLGSVCPLWYHLGQLCCSLAKSASASASLRLLRYSNLMLLLLYVKGLVLFLQTGHWAMQPDHCQVLSYRLVAVSGANLTSWPTFACCGIQLASFHLPGPDPACMPVSNSLTNMLANAMQGHIVAEEQFKLSKQHYLDQLPAPEEEAPEAKEANSSLHLEWQPDNGTESAVITGWGQLCSTLCVVLVPIF